MSHFFTLKSLLFDFLLIVVMKIILFMVDVIFYPILFVISIVGYVVAFIIYATLRLLKMVGLFDPEKHGISI